MMDKLNFKDVMSVGIVVLVAAIMVYLVLSQSTPSDDTIDKMIRQTQIDSIITVYPSIIDTTVTEIIDDDNSL